MLSHRFFKLWRSLMIFAPVRLGETSLNAEAVAADKKSCKRFGPCGVGKNQVKLV